MKKFTLILMTIIAFSGFSMAQIIEDFEIPGLTIQTANPSIDKSSFSFVPNPDPIGINTSSTVLKFIRGKNNQDWNGFICPITPFIVENMYVHMKVWKSKISEVWFGFYPFGGGNEYGVVSKYPQTVVNGWEELVFSYASTTIYAGTLEFFPFPYGTGLTEDITMFIDDITINSDSTVGSTPEMILMDFEPIPLNLMLDGTEDQSTMTISPNPDSDPIGVNVSSHVIKYQRDKAGVPWGGFWSSLPVPIDVTTNKYMHVKVWKPRISPVKFKIEGGTAGNLEVESKYPQTKINEWEDMVFDFSSKIGIYPTIIFMPDFEDPLTLTEDITMYFDDIVLNSDSLPRTPTELVINVDMRDAGLTAKQKVYISGSFGGKYGNWASPGTIPWNEMTDTDGDTIYTIKMNLPDESVKFRFYKGNGTANGDFGLPERTWTVNGSANLNYKWQLGGLVVPANEPKKQVFNVDMTGAGLTEGQKVYISGAFGGIHGTWAEPGTNPQNEMTDSDGDKIYSITLDLPDSTYYFKFFKDAGWNGGEWAGDPNRAHSVKGSKTINFIFGTYGMLDRLNEFNLITDGQFDRDGTITPTLEFMPAWYGSFAYNIRADAKVTNGILTMTNNVAAPAAPYNLIVLQRLNEVGNMLYNDSTYFLIFDAWANKERVFTIDLEDHGGNNYKRFGLSNDADAVNGESQWDVNLTTTKTTYFRKVKMNAIKPNSSFNFTIQTAADTGVVYLDNIYLISLNDIKEYGVKVSGIKVTGEGGTTAISTDKGTLRMNAAVLPEDAWIKNVEWSVINGSGNAVIGKDGLLTAVTDGKVTVVATAVDGSGTLGSTEITLSNQARPGFPIDFEIITDMAWNVLDNGTYSPGQFSIVANPGKSTSNTSDYVLLFRINKDAETYSGASSEAFGPLEFTCYDYVIILRIRKSVKSPVGVKFEQSTNGGPDTLVTVSNTGINAWQTLRFEFPSCAGYTYSKITIYPDIRETRTGDATAYIDNIELVKSSTTACTTEIQSSQNSYIQVYPNPFLNELFIEFECITSNTDFEILNSIGHSVLRGKLKESTVVQTNSFTPGMYIVKLISGEKSEYRKIIKL